MIMSKRKETNNTKTPKILGNSRGFYYFLTKTVLKYNLNIFVRL